MVEFLESVKSWFITKRNLYGEHIVIKGSNYIEEKSTGDFIIYDMIKDNASNDYRKNWFSSFGKIILGVNKNISNSGVVENGRGGKVVWHFNTEHLFKKRIIKARLNIKTSRANTGLHTSRDQALNALKEVYEGKRKTPRSALIKINGIEVDRILILSKMGTTLDKDDYISLSKQFPNKDLDAFLSGYMDYGYNKIDSYDVEKFINNSKNLEVEITFDDNVYWDVDEMSIDDIVYENSEFNALFWMVIGAIISTAFGILGSKLFFCN